MNWIADIQPAHLDIEKLRNVQRQTLDLDLANVRLQNTPADDTFGFADKMKRHMNLDGGRQVDLVKIGMNDRAGNGVVLHVFDQRDAVG